MAYPRILSRMKLLLEKVQNDVHFKIIYYFKCPHVQLQPESQSRLVCRPHRQVGGLLSRQVLIMTILSNFCLLETVVCFGISQ